MNRRFFLNSLAGACAASMAAPALALTPVAVKTAIKVYKTPSCGCCQKWVDYLKAEGFDVTVADYEDLDQFRERFGAPETHASCHIAEVQGYYVEGHVPAADIRKLLAEKPKARGIVVPGMPIGSPGMEVGKRRDPYDVVLIDKDGKPSVFTSYR